jgi:hypothetical protein
LVGQVENTTLIVSTLQEKFSKVLQENIINREDLVTLKERELLELQKDLNRINLDQEKERTRVLFRLIKS